MENERRMKMNDNTRLEFEALLTEREGYLAENQHRMFCGNSIAYAAGCAAERIATMIGGKNV